MGSESVEEAINRAKEAGLVSNDIEFFTEQDDGEEAVGVEAMDDHQGEEGGAVAAASAHERREEEEESEEDAIKTKSIALVVDEKYKGSSSSSPPIVVVTAEKAKVNIGRVGIVGIGGGRAEGLSVGTGREGG